MFSVCFLSLGFAYVFIAILDRNLHSSHFVLLHFICWLICLFKPISYQFRICFSLFSLSNTYSTLSSHAEYSLADILPEIFLDIFSFGVIYTYIYVFLADFFFCLEELFKNLGRTKYDILANNGVYTNTYQGWRKFKVTSLKKNVKLYRLWRYGTD